jgi:hypothetical protein
MMRKVVWNFLVPIYGGNTISRSRRCTPLFIAAAQDDPVVSVSSAQPLRGKTGRVELHLYSQGGRPFRMT